MKYFLLSTIILLNISLHAYDVDTLYRDNTASYISKITKDIVKQFKNSNNASSIEKGTIVVTPMVNINDFKETLPITNRIDENLIYELSINAFKVIDTRAMNTLGVREIPYDYLVISNFTNYRYEMVINSRIVDKKTGVVCASAQVQVPKKILKSVNKLYNKNSWFQGQEVKEK